MGKMNPSPRVLAKGSGRQQGRQGNHQKFSREGLLEPGQQQSKVLGPAGQSLWRQGSQEISTAWRSTSVCGAQLCQQRWLRSSLLITLIVVRSTLLSLSINVLRLMMSPPGIHSGLILGHSTSTGVLFRSCVQISWILCPTRCVWHDWGSFSLEPDSTAHALNMADLVALLFGRTDANLTVLLSMLVT